MRRVKLPLCKYAQDESTGNRVLVKCTITNDLCPMIRWCPANNCPRMNDKYKSNGCKMAIKKDNEERLGGN